MNESRGPLDRYTGFQALIAAATLLMVGLSWPLWVDSGHFPRVPFVQSWPEAGRPLSWGLFATLVVSLAAVVVGRGGRWAWGVSVTIFAGLILGDQNRLQPWVQQYLALGMAVVCLPRSRAIDMARWYLVVLYAASGLSKLDAAFVDELGGTFLATIGHLVGASPEGWTFGSRTAATLAMPVGELAIAVALAIPMMRTWGLVGSVVQHLATIAILGPWALNHSTIVLVWNAAILLENCILFGPRRDFPPAQPRAGLAAGLLVVALVGLERWGWVDTWPSHALYASHAERAAIGWPESEANALPASVRRWLGPPDEEGLSRLDLTGWSRAERGVPFYPQNRVACGIAEALAERYGIATGPPVRVVFWDRAGIVRKPPRTRTECLGLGAIHRRGDRFWINAHPSPGFGR